MRSSRVRRGAALLAAVLVLSVLPLHAHATLTAASIVSGSTRSGTVRVYLSSLSGVNTLNLTLAGGYTASDGSTYASGSAVKVSYSNGALYLTYGGAQKNMGLSFTLKRDSASLSAGLKIAEAKAPANLYTGDFTFVVRSGKMYPIAHIYMEEYLYGVLPYEMSNSFPLEALKAQAVAARTYTLAAMDKRSTYYDVVDTTSDQVYRGLPTGNANCRQAVDSTAGMVAVYNGSVISANYSASNGGQTESIKNAWGTSGHPYLDVHDDPYDYANSASTVKRVTISGDGSSPASLMSLLKTKLSSKLPSLGYQSATDTVQITAVSGVTPHTPMYASPSKLYTKVDFALRVSAINSSTGSREQVPGTVNVTLDYFSEMESLLGLSIQSTKNELIDVTQSGNNFVLNARRYGHGLGMSQRGAQQMANQGYNMQQIIGFYYTGVSIAKYTLTRDGAAVGAGDPGSTGDGGSVAVETPVDASKAQAVVTLSNPYSSLNLRAQAGTYAAILANLAHGTTLSVISTDGVWYKVTYGSLTGYVMGSYLTFTGTGAEATATPSPDLNATASPMPDPSATATPAAEQTTQAVVQLKSSSSRLNLRAGPSTSSMVLTRLTHGTTLTVTGGSNGWLQVRYGMTQGYVSSAYVEMLGSGTIPDGTQATQAPGSATTATVGVPAGQTLNLREWPTSAANILARLPSGTQLTVLSAGAEWTQVQYSAAMGYVMTSFLTFPQATATPEATATPTPDPDATPAPTPDPNATASPEPTESPLPAESPVPTVTPTAYRTAVVTLRYSTSRLNLRASASGSAKVLGAIPHGATVQVYAESGTWSEIQYGSLRGYVSTSYLEFEKVDLSSLPTITAQPTATPEGGRQWVQVIINVNSALNLRASPSMDSAVTTSIPGGTQVSAISEDATWYYVEWNSYTGYIAKSYTQLVETAATQTVPPTQTPEVADVVPLQAAADPTMESFAVELATATPLPQRPDAGLVINQGKVADTATQGAQVYGMPEDTSAKLLLLSAGEAVKVVDYLGDNAEWCDVVTEKTRGYVQRELLSLEHPVGIVSLANSGSTLTLRAGPSAESDIIGYVSNGGLTVLANENGWVKVHVTGDLQGYVSAEYLKSND